MPRKQRRSQLPMEALPKVAIVGRPNVGKSALFNRLAGSSLAVVYDYPGVTRDRLYTRAFWGDKEYCLIDTGEHVCAAVCCVLCVCFGGWGGGCRIVPGVSLLVALQGGRERGMPQQQQCVRGMWSLTPNMLLASRPFFPTPSAHHLPPPATTTRRPDE